MRINKRQGFQFSFGLKLPEDNYSSRSTPKFPSIQINKINQTSSDKKKLYSIYEKQHFQTNKSLIDIFKDMSGGIDLLQKGMQTRQKRNYQKIMTSIINNDSHSIDSKDNKSIKSNKSSKSLGERFQKRIIQANTQKPIKLISTKKQSSSLANILQLKFQSHHTLKQDRKPLFSFKNSPHFSLEKTSFDQIQQKNNPAKDTVKLEGNFFENSQSNLEFRETKKMLQTFERSKMKKEGSKTQVQEREGSKIFKNYMHKPRPTLKFTPRILNNQKIESISKRFEGFHL